MLNWWNRLRKDHKGFSLVELICTVAIFSIVITGVGSAMVISARSYSNGNVELDLQQQAQITANLLTNLIIDANVIEEPSSETGGALLRIKKEEAGAAVVYEVTHDAANAQLLYSREGGTPQILAEHISAFSIRKVSSNNYDFSLTVTEGARSYESDYHVTPRNGASEETNTALGGAKSLYVENKLILEPGQEYDLAIRILGTSLQDYSIQNLSGNISSDTSVTRIDSQTAKIKVGLSEIGTGTGNEAGFTFNVVPEDSSIAPVSVKVLIRRVNSVNVNGYKTANGGKVNKAGATYKVVASLLGTNLEKEPGVWYDVDYVNPYTVEWSCEFTKTDEYGNSITFPVGDYIQEIGRGVDNNIPYLMFKLKQDMVEGSSLKVVATALHPEGVFPVGSANLTNKSGQKYGTVVGTWVLEYQAWRRNGKLDITVPLTDRDFWFYDNGTSWYKHTASVSFVGWNKFGIKTEEQTFNPFTGSQNALLNVEIPPMCHIHQLWNLVLNVKTDSGDANGFYDRASYSTPYHAAKVVDQWEDQGLTAVQTRGYTQRYNITSAYNWRDTSSYDVKITYQHQLEDGTVETTVIEESYAIEDVTIMYRNSNHGNWARDNIIYVTPQDTITEYTVYFKFDKGWDGEDFYFHDLSRFVGVIHDDVDYTKDVRRDIPISSSIPDRAGVYAGDSYLTFVMDSAEKQKCYDLAKPYGGVIQEIYEYNPYFGNLNMEIQNGAAFWTWSEEQWADKSNYVALDNPYNGYGVTQAQVDMMKGCKGKLLFCFKDPNITVAGGVIPKVMYCPTITEYGPLYYIDNTTRFAIGANSAQYQMYESGSWVTKSNLTWDVVANGWIAN